MAHAIVKAREPRARSKIYAQRDPVWKPFLTATWNPAAPHYGFQDIENGLSKEEQKENCEMFIEHIATFLKDPFWDNRLKERATSLKKIWEIFDFIFTIETSASSFLDLSLIKHDGTESYHSFLARIIYHIENNLTPANVNIDGLSSGEGDNMDITKMDLAVTIWLEKLDPCLIEIIKTD